MPVWVPVRILWALVHSPQFPADKTWLILPPDFPADDSYLEFMGLGTWNRSYGHG